MYAHIPSFGKSNQLKKNTFPCFPKVGFYPMLPDCQLSFLSFMMGYYLVLSRTIALSRVDCTIDENVLFIWLSTYLSYLDVLSHQACIKCTMYL